MKGIFGGAFNPPHNEHIAMIKESLKAGLEEIIVVPSSNPPHKKCYTSFEHRRNMLCIALLGIKNVTIDDLENKDDNTHYSFRRGPMCFCGKWLFFHSENSFKILNILVEKQTGLNFALIEGLKWIDDDGNEHIEDLYVDVLDCLMKDWVISQKYNDKWWDKDEFVGMTYEEWLKLDVVPVYSYTKEEKRNTYRIRNIVRPIYGKYDIFV